MIFLQKLNGKLHKKEMHPQKSKNFRKCTSNPKQVVIPLPIFQKNAVKLPFAALYNN